jgi:hypothetical protein
MKNSIKKIINLEYKFKCLVLNNDIFNLKKIMSENPDIKFSHCNFFAIAEASELGHIDVIKLLLSDSRVDPSLWGNEAISRAYKKNFFNIVDLLWNDNRVKDTLFGDNTNIYNFLIRKNKINNF